MYAIMGATGNTGRAAVYELLRRGCPVRAITRDPLRAEALRRDGAEVVRADPQDARSLTAAFAGTRAVFVMVPPYLAADDAWAESGRAARAIASALRDSGTEHAVVLSSGGAHLLHGSGIISTLRDLEQMVLGSGVPSTFLRAADFMENWRPVLPVVVSEGVLPTARVPLDRPFQTIAAADIGRRAAAHLCALPPPSNRFLNLVGPAEYAPIDFAAALGRIIGREVVAASVPVDEMIAAAKRDGLGDSYAGGLAEVYRGLNSGHIGFEPGIGSFERGTITVEDALRAMMAGAGEW